MRAPSSWRRTGSPLSLLLTPASWAYGAVAARRMERARPPRVPCAVICVGNPTVGGAGKTPTAIAIARAAKEGGFNPAFLSRGYARKQTEGSNLRSVLVDPERHSAREVGDEPLLLARVAPTVVSAQREAGARKLVERGHDLVIMDDGFQSRALHMDAALLVIDGALGIENGRVFPAGPLRAPLRTQLAHADALIVIDSGAGVAGAEPVVRAAARSGLRRLDARLVPREPQRFRGKRFVAFSGIGDPDKFVRTLHGCGATVAARWDFADHHVFEARDVAALRRLADLHKAPLVTTAKDAVRLTRVPDMPDFEVLEVELEFSRGDLERLVRGTVEAYRRSL